MRGTTALNWDANTALSNWTGIEVGAIDGVRRVTKLNLNCADINGTIPPALGRLTGLSRLQLAWSNQLTGSIPPEIGQLNRLTYLNLAGNHLSGPIPPELGDIGPQLTDLILSGPRPLPDGVGLTGSIPAQLGYLTGLEDLYLDGHRLAGSIPPRLGRLLNLRWLILNRNQLSGPIPTQLGARSSLTHLQAEDNRLSGPLPSQLNLLNNLRKLYLKRNAGFSGCIPHHLRDVRHHDLSTLILPDCASDAPETPATPLPTFNLTTTAGDGGAIDPPGASTHTEGVSVIVTASWNDATHTFAGWSGDCTGADTTCTLELYADASVTAAFTPLPADRCATPTDPTCIRAVYLGVPDDYAQVQDIPAELLLTPNPDGRYLVERGQQVTVVTAAPLPADYTRFYLQQAPLGQPWAVSFLQLVKPVGTTYTFTVSEDEGAATLITFDLHAARPNPLGRPGLKPILGDVVVSTEIRVASCARTRLWPTLASTLNLVKDCERMIQLRDVLAGSGSLNWDVRTMVTGWSGVTLSGSPLRVTQLDLASVGLTGELTGLLGALDGLSQLRLNDNTLTGQIPSKTDHAGQPLSPLPGQQHAVRMRPTRLERDRKQ